MTETDLALPPELGRLSSFIDSHIECLAGPNSELRSIALYAAKYIFDWALETEKSSKPHLGVLLSTLARATPPQTRSQARQASTRRRSPSPSRKPSKKIVTQGTPLPSLFIDGMNVDQMWQQLDLRAARICENLQILLGDEEGEGKNASTDGEEDAESEDENEDEDEDESHAEEMDIDEAENAWEELSDGDEDGSSTAEGVVDLQDEIFEDDEDEGPAIHGQTLRPSVSHSRGRSELDDGFFDLATFNSETRELEAKEVHKRQLNSVTDEDSAEESEVDLFTSVDHSMSEGADDDYVLFYCDFFEPPSRAQNNSMRSSKVRFHEQVSVRKIKAVGKGMPVSSMGDEDSDEEESSDSDDDGH